MTEAEPITNFDEPMQPELTPEQLGIISPAEFERMVEQIIWDSDDDLTHVEAVLEVAADLGLDEEGAGMIVTPSLKAKLELDFMNRKMMPQRGVLQMDL